MEDEGWEVFYQWKAGFNPYYNKQYKHCSLFWFGAPLSLDAIGMLNSVGHNLWSPAFIPLLLSHEGQTVLFNNERGEGYGRLCLFDPRSPGDPPVSCYDSLSGLVATAIAGYRQSALQYDPDHDGLRIDADAYKKIARGINLHSDYWTD